MGFNHCYFLHWHKCIETAPAQPVGEKRLKKHYNTNASGNNSPVHHSIIYAV